MLSQLTEAMIVNGVVLATVLASDLGPARKIGPARLLRPVIAAAIIIPLFVDRPAANTSSLAVELAGIAARAAFSYGAAHWFTAQIVAWAVANRVTEAAIVDGLIFMAITMVLVRTAVLGVRASRLPVPCGVPEPA